MTRHETDGTVGNEELAKQLLAHRAMTKTITDLTDCRALASQA